LRASRPFTIAQQNTPNASNYQINIVSPEVFLWLLPIDYIDGSVICVSRSPVRSFQNTHLCHQFGSRSAHGFAREAPCPRQPAQVSPVVRRAKGHASAFRANHSETPTVDIGRRALSGSRFGRSAFNALTLWRKAFRDVSVSVRRTRTRRRRLGTYRPGNPDGRLVERRRHRPDASWDRLPSRTAGRRA
jgi:hypothetical protein